MNLFVTVGLYEPLYDNVPCKPPEGTTVCRSSFLRSFDTCFSYPFFPPHSIFPSQCSRDTNLRPCFSILSFISRVWLVRVEMFRAYDLALDSGHRKSEGWMLVSGCWFPSACVRPEEETPPDWDLTSCFWFWYWPWLWRNVGFSEPRNVVSWARLCREELKAFILL